MSELTTATDITLESATDDVTADRWTNYGHDRLYIDGIAKADKYDLHVDLQTNEVVSGNESALEGDVTVEGDTATVTIVSHVGLDDTEYTLTLSLEGDEFEAEVEDGAEETETEDETHGCEECGDDFDSEHGLAVHEGIKHGDDEDETQPDEGQDADDTPTAVADGGTAADYVSDATIQQAIAHQDDPDHPDATTIAEVRELLAHLNDAVAAGWAEYTDGIEDGTIQVIDDSDGVLVLDTGEIDMAREELERTYEGPVEIDDVTFDVVSKVLHEIAYERTDHNWGTTYPLVAEKPDGADDGERYVQALINGLLDAGLSPAEAWSYYGVELKDNSQSAWARRTGKNQSTVKRALDRAAEKLPR